MDMRSSPEECAVLPLPANDGCSRFDIYRTERVSFTATLSGGGDWHWRLIAPSGQTLVDCGGYLNQADCLLAVEALRREAGSAAVWKLELGPHRN